MKEGTGATVTSDPLRVGRDTTVEDRRTTVLRAALACIAAQGSGNVRLKDVSREAGVSVGLLQHYFESRDELVALAFRQASEDLLAGWSAAIDAGEGPWQRLVHLVDHLLERDSLRDRCLIWIEYAAAAARHPDTMEGFTAVYRHWEQIVDDVVREGVEGNVFRPQIEVPQAVELILEHIDGTILRVASGIYPIDRGALKRSILALCSQLLGLNATS